MNILEMIRNAFAGIRDFFSFDSEPTVASETNATVTAETEQGVEEVVQKQPPVIEGETSKIRRITADDFKIPVLGSTHYYGDNLEKRVKPKIPSGDEAVKLVQEGKTVSMLSRKAAQQEYTDKIGQYENAASKGLTGKGSTARWNMFESFEGVGKDKNMSKFEIAHGIKIPKSWLSNDQSKWPKINGIPTDVRKGLSPDQANFLKLRTLEKVMNKVDQVLTNSEVTERERMFWTDLGYNGGEGALTSKENPSAMKALKAGNTSEAMIKVLDYINAGGQGLRGLLKRRIDMYNVAASSKAGLPKIEKYTWENNKVKVKFSYPNIMDATISDEFKKNIDSEGWFHLKNVKKVNTPVKGVQSVR